MSLTIKHDTPEHFPAKPDKFEFDAEVSAIFDDMAQRSIPMYREAHRIHADIAYHAITKINLVESRKANILDFGCSTGTFINELCRRFQESNLDLWECAKVEALDNSPHMLEQLSIHYPEALLREEDALEAEFHDQYYDVINTSYLVQFLPPNKKVSTMSRLSEGMRPRGLLIYSQKAKISKSYRDSFDSMYIQFRKQNGYSTEEIEAKTKALKNSMWCLPDWQIEALLGACGFSDIQATARWLHFCSLVARKD